MLRNIRKELVFLRIYIVQKGDTLHKIAKKHDVPLEEVIRLNSHISDPEYIVPGMKITLPNTIKKSKDKKRKNKQKSKTTEAARTKLNHRPLGAVAEMTDRGIAEANNRIALQKRHYFTSQGLNKKTPEEKYVGKTAQETRKRENSKQYRYESTKPTRPTAQEPSASHPRPGPTRNNQFDSPYSHHPFNKDTRKNNPKVQPYPTPAYPYCPCCMYHWHMQQLHEYERQSNSAQGRHDNYQGQNYNNKYK